jgi:hypothetical protein
LGGAILSEHCEPPLGLSIADCDHEAQARPSRRGSQFQTRQNARQFADSSTARHHRSGDPLCANRDAD